MAGKDTCVNSGAESRQNWGYGKFNEVIYTENNLSSDGAGTCCYYPVVMPILNVELPMKNLAADT